MSALTSRAETFASFDAKSTALPGGLRLMHSDPFFVGKVHFAPGQLCGLRGQVTLLFLIFFLLLISSTSCVSRHLRGLVKCGCCGGGFTIIGKDRYGCYRRKTQSKQECGNSRMISRQKLEARVLDRLRRGLMTPAFAAQFAAEVERLLKAERQNDGGHKVQLESRIAEAEGAIERLLDRLEGD